MFAIGADLGQSVDYTAIGIIEKTGTLDLRHIERVPLGKSYTSVVDHLAALKVALPGSRLVIDNTGVGRPVRDMLRHTPCVVFARPSISPAYAGAGLRRRSSIRITPTKPS